MTSYFGWPISALASVLLPEPFGPISAWISPCLTVRLTPRRISLPSTETCRSSIRNVGCATCSWCLQAPFLHGGSRTGDRFDGDEAGRRWPGSCSAESSSVVESSTLEMLRWTRSQTERERQPASRSQACGQIVVGGALDGRDRPLEHAVDLADGDLAGLARSGGSRRARRVPPRPARPGAARRPAARGRPAAASRCARSRRATTAPVRAPARARSSPAGRNDSGRNLQPAPAFPYRRAGKRSRAGLADLARA